MKSSLWEVIRLFSRRQTEMGLLTSFLEAAALCNGVNHTWSLAFTVAPASQRGGNIAEVIVNVAEENWITHISVQCVH